MKEQWHNIDTAPLDRWVWVGMPTAPDTFAMWMACRRLDGGWKAAFVTEFEIHPTHWMELPSSPYEVPLTQSDPPQIEVTPEMIEAAMDEYAGMWSELWEDETEACVTRLLRRALNADKK